MMRERERESKGESKQSRLPSKISSQDQDRRGKENLIRIFFFFSNPVSVSSPSRYLVGIHDPETSTITLKAAPLLKVSRSVKALASEPTARKTATGNMFEDRRALGEAFGNRKQKQNARNQDKMRVNLSEDKGAESEAIMNHVMGEIAEATKGMQGASEYQNDSKCSENFLSTVLMGVVTDLESRASLFFQLSKQAKSKPLQMLEGAFPNPTCKPNLLKMPILSLI